MCFVRAGNRISGINQPADFGLAFLQFWKALCVQRTLPAATWYNKINSQKLQMVFFFCYSVKSNEWSALYCKIN